MGSCSGGITLSTYVAWLAGQKLKKINAVVLAVCVLDTMAATDNDFAALVTPETIMAAKQMSKARGILDGHEMAKMFAWMRPNDLIWNYWVNNYLLGNKPPAFDVLYWNADTTRLPARLHGDFLDLIFTNPFMNAREDVDPRRTDRHEKGEARDLCDRWHHRSHHAVEGGLSDSAASMATRPPSSFPIPVTCRAC